MPELPEVETIRRGLAGVLPGKRIARFTLRLPKVFHVVSGTKRSQVTGSTVESVKRRGKVLLIGLSGERTLVIHLKMTGQLIFREHAKVVLAGGHPIPTVDGKLPSRVTHAVFRFSDGSELFYNDLRQFGYIKLVPNMALEDIPILRTMGPEPLEKSFRLEVLSALLKRRPNAKLKPLLLDQTSLAGLGNIYVDEILNLARLHPLRTARSLTPEQRRRLFKATATILRASLKAGGTSDNTYVTIRGGKGDYLTQARVYHRTGEPCRRCGTLIKRIVVVGRGTHYCPRCQRAPRKTKPTKRRAQ